MDELINFINSFDTDSYSYFYHITSKGFGEKAIEEGLFLEEEDLKSTTIKVPLEMIENPIEYCEGEYTDGNVKRQEMVIIACDKGSERYLVEKNDIPIFLGDRKYNYIINSENILGYIDLQTLEVIHNYNSMYGDGGMHV